MKPRPARQRLTEPTVRIGGALAVLSVLKDLGVEPAELMNEVGIDPQVFDNPDGLISYRARGRLISHCVARTGCQHFGLLIGERMNLGALGFVGVMARNAKDVGEALDRLVRLLYLHSSGALMSLTVEGAWATLSYSAAQSSVEAADQIGDGALAMAQNVLRELCGPAFRPAEVRFAHRRPKDVRPYRRVFRVPLRFDAEQNAIVFSRDWLSIRMPDIDPELQRFLQRQLEVLKAESGEEFPAQVRRVLRFALLAQQADAEQIAAAFAMHPRTLNRHLADYGLSFRQLADQVRFEMARQMLEETSRNVGQIAESLAYSRSSAFTRAFRNWSGMTPKDWRAMHVRET